MSKSLLHVWEGRASAGPRSNQRRGLADNRGGDNRGGLERLTQQESPRDSLKRAVQNLFLGVSVVGVTLVAAALWVVASVVLDMGY
jgi:hypothetical protein